MINHVRTLILNRSGKPITTPYVPPSSSSSSMADEEVVTPVLQLTGYMEEYVDPTFVAQTLPSYLRTLYNILIPVRADESFANFRMRQFTTILSSTEFQAYVLALDPRITYEDSGSVAERTKNITIYGFDSAAQATPVYPQGDLTPATTDEPYILRSWSIEAVSPLLVRTTNLKTGKILDTTITIDNDLSSPIPMAGQPELSVRISGAALPVASKWVLEAFAPAVADLSDLLTPLYNVTQQQPQIFFPPNVEPFKTFKALWEKHPLVNYRLSGLLLAFAYQADILRNVDNG